MIPLRFTSAMAQDAVAKDDWSPEARKAAAEARKAKSGGGSKAAITPLHHGANKSNPYPHSASTHEQLAQHHENMGAKHYQNATLQSAHLTARRNHVAAAKALKSRSPDARKLSNRAHNFAAVNRLQ